MKTANGALVARTFARTRAEAIWALFPLMATSFQNAHWKRPKETWASYRRLGIRAVKVELREVAKP